jgi:ATP-dependent helicase HrpB
MDTSQLPIHEVLAELQAALHQRNEAVLQAPPGAGKTTVVPLALLQADWLQGQTILVLEPRRMAARAAAARMAQLLGEKVGETVGYRIRLDSNVGENTRIEVITEGILTRRLQRDPGLEGVGLVIFDEFHERNLDSDLALALALQGREVFREGPPLKLLAMSATLDGEGVAELMGRAPIVTSAGRQYPVDIHYGEAYQLRESILPRVMETVAHALQVHTGNILVFLPGQGEITRLAQMLAARGEQLCPQPLTIAPLYGSLPLAKQQLAIAPPPAGERKVVLATNIAETSLTIEGVNVVVDSGLAREAIFDSATGMTRLTTRRIARSSADQRAGRAGRLEAGHCYRLWSEEQQRRLVSYPTPEILQADLAPLALQLLAWGVQQPGELAWLDEPPAGPFAQAVSILESCGAAFLSSSGVWQLTPHGVRLSAMPLHPRLSHMLLVGCDVHALESACLLAAVLSERNPLADRGVDLSVTLSVLTGERQCPRGLEGWYKRCWQQARRFSQVAQKVHKARKFAIQVCAEDVLGVLLASAYPDRIARRRFAGDGSQYQLSNGRAAVLPTEDALAGEQWLAVAEIGGHVGESEDRIYSGVSLNPAVFQEVLSPLVRHRDCVEWDYRSNQFVAERRSVIGQICLQAEPLRDVPEQARIDALLGVVRKKGLAMLPWTPAVEQWRARVMLLHRLAESGDEQWPDLSDRYLLDTLENWLAPYLNNVQKLQDFQSLDLLGILQATLQWPQSLELERQAPERLAVPSGSTVPIDYSQDPPVLAVKLQEMFGCLDTPCIAQGRQQLSLHLLSPARRPLQITQDLAGFWRGAYAEVRKEMKGRYPKHPWPEDPVSAEATAWTKRRLAQADS